MDKKLVAFQRLINIVCELRMKCPWDKKQTILSLRNLTIEETYELADAILDEDMEEIKRELGDLMMHIVFYAQIAAEKKVFDMADVIDSICEKLIFRHPHIYRNVKVKNAEEVKQNWEQLKLKEGKKSILQGVPVSLPSLVKAMRIQEKVKQVGFEWENTEQVWEKIKEELMEFKHEVEKNKKNKTINKKQSTLIRQEFGDLLFSLVNYARYLNIDAETALEMTNKKFIKRFQQIEKMAARKGKNLKEMTLQEMDKMWNLIKKEK